MMPDSSGPALRILGHVVDHHLIALAAALEPDAGELQRLEETLGELEGEAGT